MAIIQASYSWPDGSSLLVVVSGKARYPQALADLRAEHRRACHGMMAELGIEVVAEDAELVEPEVEAVE